MSNATQQPAPASAPIGMGWAFGIDVVAVIIFAALGRGAHQRTPGLAGLAETAWPFLVGLCVGWVLWAVTRRGPATLIPAGAWIWVSTLFVGMVIWGVREGKVPHWSFLLVAGVATLVLLLGWRLVAQAVARR